MNNNICYGCKHDRHDGRICGFDTTCRCSPHNAEIADLRAEIAYQNEVIIHLRREREFERRINVSLSDDLEKYRAATALNKYPSEEPS